MCDAKLSLPGSVSLKAITCPTSHACLNSEMYAIVCQCLINGIAAASLIFCIYSNAEAFPAAATRPLY